MTAKELKDKGFVPAWANYLTQGKAGWIYAHMERPSIRIGFFGENWISNGMSARVNVSTVDEFTGKDWKLCLYAY